CGGMPGDPVDVPPSDVLFNAICNPDTNKKSLAAASDAIHQLGLPVVNQPKNVLQTSRDALCARFGRRPGLRIPLAIRIRPAHPSDVADMIDRGEVRCPFLV